MYTTMFSVLLAGAGLATGQGYYGGYGSYGDYGTYGSFSGGSGCQYRGGYAYPTTTYPFTSSDVVRADDPGRKELEKQLSGLMQKIKDLETRVVEEDRLRDLAQANQKLHDRLAEAITRMNDKIDNRLAEISKLVDAKAAQPVLNVDPARINDNGSSTKLAVLEERLRNMEERERMIRENANTMATNEALTKMIKLLETIAPANAEIAKGINNIRIDLHKVILEHSEAPVSTQPIRTGHSLARGLIIVSLPADAKLFLDNMPSNVGTNLRTFISPELESGKSYFYNLRLEVERSGKIFTDTQKIYFQPGREVHVSFDHIEAAIANRLQRERGE